MRLDLRLWEFSHGQQADPDIEIYVDHPTTPARHGYQEQFLIEDPYVVVVPVGHRLAGTEEIALAELMDQTWVDNDITRGACRQILIDAATVAGFTPVFHLEPQDYAAAIAFVEAGAGITVMPHLAYQSTATHRAVTAARLIEPAVTRRIMVRTKNPENPTTHRVLETLMSQLERTSASKSRS